MSTAVPLPLDPVPYAEPISAGQQAREARALRMAVAERLEQHRRRRGAATPHGSAQGALPGMETASDSDWTTAKPNRIADSVAARFAKSQSYRDFLQEEAEAATRQAEAAAEVARRNAEAIAAAQQQLLEEMREWEERQRSSSADLSGEVSAEPALFQQPALAEPGVLLPMPSAVEPAKDFTVLAPSEALREAADPAASLTLSAIPLQTAPVEAPPAGKTSNSVVQRVSAATPAPTAAADPTPLAPAAVSAVPVRIAMPVNDPAEPPVPIPANLIEFPRQLVAARKARPRLAEGPLREEADTQPERAQLRIFEVEASSFSTTPVAEPASALPEWSSIRLDSSTAPHETAQPDAQVSTALPIFAAPLERRIMAAAVDGCCIGTAFLLAVAAAGMAGGVLPTGLFALGASAVTLLLFGIGYLLLSFTLSGQTPGMRYARIALCTFGDDNPTRSAMRRRLFAMGLSAVSLGLGFAWAMLDDDKLGWHDRISRMYQRAY